MRREQEKRRKADEKRKRRQARKELPKPPDNTGSVADNTLGTPSADELSTNPGDSMSLSHDSGGD